MPRWMQDRVRPGRYPLIPANATNRSVLTAIRGYVGIVII